MSLLTNLMPRTPVRGQLLPDGSRIVVRLLEPSDADLVRAVFDRLGPSSRYHRFLVPKKTLTESDVRQLTAIDHCDHEAVAAVSAADGEPVGVARFIRLRDYPDTAEVAVTIVDKWQGRGVGSILVEALVTRARHLGVRRFSVFMTPDNQGAAHLMKRLPGDVVGVGVDRQAAEFVVSLDPDDVGGDRDGAVAPCRHRSTQVRYFHA